MQFTLINKVKMKKSIFYFGALVSALLLFACSFTSAQTFTYTINPGNIPDPLSKITNSLTPITQGTGTISNGDNIAVPWVNINSTMNTGYTFTVNNLPTGAADFQWSVRGDLQADTPVNTTSVTIKHFNQANRNTPTDLAQSKGRVIFHYTYPVSGCLVRISTSITFDVFKQFAGTHTNNSTDNIAVPAIIGPNCLLPNKQYTYSVDPIVSDNLNAQIGTDNYLWDVSQALVGSGAAINYYSTDFSSITFTTGSTVPPNCTLKCWMGSVNYPPLQPLSTSQAVAIKTLQASAGVPVVTVSGAATDTLSTTAPLCINTNDTTVTPLTFTVTTQPGVTYSWTFGTVGAFGTGSVNNWNTTPAQSGAIPYTAAGPTLTIANIFNQPGVVTLTVTDACGTITNYHYQIKRTLTATNANLITLSNTCLVPGSSASVTLSNAAAKQANLNTLVWAPLTDWTLSSSSVGPNASVAPGSYTLFASFSGCASATVPYTVNVRPAAVAIVAPSPRCFPRNTPGNSIIASPAGTTYTWATTAGSITGTTDTASLTTLNTSPFNITATYTVAPGCATTGVATANLSPVAPTVTIPSCISSGVPGATISLPITNYPGYGSYTLTFVSGTNIINGTPTTSTGTLTATLNGASGSGVYTLTHTNGPCAGAAASVTLATSPAPFTVNAFNFGAFALIVASNNTIPYQWFNCTSNTLLGNTAAGTTSWQLNTTLAGANNDFGARATIGGCTYRVCINVPGYQAKQINNGTMGVNDLPESTGRIYPNPNRGDFTIELSRVNSKASTIIYDMTGKTIYRSDLKQGTNKISNTDLTNGKYLVTLLVDGVFYTKNIQISK
jgi:hypothetical protein